MSCTDAPAGVIPGNTPLRRFAKSLAPTPSHNVKLRENIEGIRNGWAARDVLITEPGKKRGRWVLDQSAG